MSFTDTSEKGFQKIIANYLVATQKLIETSPTEFDREFSIKNNYWHLLRLHKKKHTK
jgi:hypothetical protein